MGLDHKMTNLTLAKIELKKLVDRFDVIVITERIFESLVLIAQRNSLNMKPHIPLLENVQKI